MHVSSIGGIIMLLQIMAFNIGDEVAPEPSTKRRRTLFNTVHHGKHRTPTLKKFPTRPRCASCGECIFEAQNSLVSEGKDYHEDCFLGDRHLFNGVVEEEE